jgi:predicted DCC family thiol-disulfide oxidoreductase YuxK
MAAVILFDGICNFCNSSINFVIEHDSKGYFKFAPLQSAVGEELIAEHGIDPNETDSVILVEDGKAYTHSAAALRIARKLDGIWSLGYVFHHRAETDPGCRLQALREASLSAIW